jgi:hypothetical protein
MAPRLRKQGLVRRATRASDDQHHPDGEDRTTVEIGPADAWVATRPPQPIFGEPPDPSKAIAIPGTYFGLSLPHPGREVRLPARTPRAPAAHRRWRRVVSLALAGLLLLIVVGLVTWLSLRYHGVGLDG